MELPRESVLALKEARGWRIGCLSGALWITQEGERYDAIVEAGQPFEVTRPGKTVLVALRDAKLTVVGPASARLSLICSSPMSLPYFS